MRGQFAFDLYNEMAKNKDIMLVTGDLGYGAFDRIRDDFPKQFFNVGAAEQAGVGICCGMALRGKIPFFYSITTFALYRPFEFIRNYVDKEQIPVVIVGAGRDRSYLHDGLTHWSDDAKQVLTCFPNLRQYWPEKKDEVKKILEEILGSGKPSFLSLTRE